ncbi:pyridoxamine 5'-phosphate oxidase family protein [Microvirga sp. 2MCAF38]|uniref:pyridoxamine 5'-phosphate oxidase family protein n=1 Tax=Microvirga sp. 2MCAF38 TaxID=3232989 RepID=UPI003F9E6B50
MIDDDLATFLAGPAMIIIGTADDQKRAEIGRCVGAAVDAGADAVELVLSSWQWPRSVENLRANGRAAVTFVRPSDYVTYQLKGTATIRTATADDIVSSERYTAMMNSVMGGLGLEVAFMPWFTNREAVVVRLVVDAVYVQTPGAKAGQLKDAAS